MPTVRVCDLEPGMAVRALSVPSPSFSNQYVSSYFPNPLFVMGVEKHPYDPSRVALAFGQKGSYYFGAAEQIFETLSPAETKKFQQDALTGFRKAPYTTKGFTIGCDPEIFVEDENGVVLPAFNFLPAKGHSRRMFWDGFQAEFITEARSCLEELSRDVHHKLHDLLTRAQGVAPNSKLALKTVVNVPDTMLKACTKQQVALGCDPSLNVYGLKGVCVSDPAMLDIRFAGGHMHFGLGKLTNQRTIDEIVKSLDAIAGVTSVALFGTIENPLRRKFYGLPGEYRLPPHGLEYRTLGNGWLCHSGAMHLMWDIARAALDIGRRNLRACWEYDEQEMIEVVINGDVKGARKILTTNKEMLEAMLRYLYRDYNTRKSLKVGMHAIFNGIESVVKDPLDLPKNWEFGAIWDLENTRWSTLAARTKL